MLDFSKNIIKTVPKRRDGLKKGRVNYNIDTDVFTIIVNDKDEKIEYNTNAYDFSIIRILYAKPTNDVQEDWVKTNVNLKNKDRYNNISKYWSCIKHNQVVKGIVEDDIFIIKKY